MMRQLRDLRDITGITPEDASNRHNPIELLCMRLWGFLNNLEAYQGKDIIKASASEHGKWLDHTGNAHHSDTGAKIAPERVVPN